MAESSNREIKMNEQRKNMIVLHRTSRPMLYLKYLYYRLLKPNFAIEYYPYEIPDHNDLNSCKIQSPYYKVLRDILKRYFVEDSVIHNINMYIEKHQYSIVCDFTYCLSNYLCPVKEGKDEKSIFPLDRFTVLNDLLGNDNPFDLVIL